MKPIAWMSPDGKLSTTEGNLFYIPLYTAPRELSDEEIEEIGEQVFGNCFLDFEVADNYLDFARAILKKARGE
jgi:hypothetical protein